MRSRIIGFTLLEMSVVIAIVAVMVAIMAPLYTQQKVRANNTSLQSKLDAIEKALAEYRKKNDRLPCPAGYTDLDSVPAYGVAAGSAGTCTSATTNTCGASTVLCRLAANAVSGAVPVRTLGLSDDVMLDPWGRRITYVVDERTTASSAFTTYKPTGILGALTIYNEAGDTRSNKAILVLLSHGPNGHGAYSRSGVRVSESVTNAAELKNCKCTSAAANAVSFDNIYYQRASSSIPARSSDSFDDIVRYYTRGSFLNATDLTINR